MPRAYKYEKNMKICVCMLFQMWRVVEAADETLRQTRAEYRLQERDRDQRWEQISRGKDLPTASNRHLALL